MQRGRLQCSRQQSHLIDLYVYEESLNDCELQSNCSLLVPLIQYGNQGQLQHCLRKVEKRQQEVRRAIATLLF